MLKLKTGKKLKIWTIITHALILVGFGHGILFFVLIEIFWFPYFTRKHFSFAFNASFESHLPIVGLTTLLGQVFLTLSLLRQKQTFKIVYHIAGLCLLWLSIIYFTINIEKDTYVHFTTISCIPFLFCTIIVFAGEPIRRFYNWVLDI